MRVVAYYRVSTARQGESGLGLDGQRAAVKEFAERSGARILGEFTEIESGAKHETRPQLAAAIAQARAIRGTLVVAKLDRLARNVAFLSTLMDSDLPFIACDQPYANRLTLHILAAVAEDELARISARLKAAFAEGKKQGRRYGSANPKCKRFTPTERRKGRAAARVANARYAEEFRAQILPVAASMADKGMRIEDIVVGLNEAGYTTRRGLPWNQRSVARLLRFRTNPSDQK